MVPRRVVKKNLIVRILLLDYPYKNLTVKFISLRLNIIDVLFLINSNLKN
jgi:hypothetical protein